MPEPPKGSLAWRYASMSVEHVTASSLPWASVLAKRQTAHPYLSERHTAERASLDAHLFWEGIVGGQASMESMNTSPCATRDFFFTSFFLHQMFYVCRSFSLYLDPGRKT
jgi:hypothetical protein